MPLNSGIFFNQDTIKVLKKIKAEKEGCLGQKVATNKQKMGLIS